MREKGQLEASVSALGAPPGDANVDLDLEGGSTQVDLSSADKDGESKVEKDGVIWVDWDGANDPTNPLNWSRWRKWIITTAGVTFCAVVSMSVSGYAIAQTSIESELRASPILVASGVTLFTVMFGTAPLLGAPLSEVYGRSGVYLISSVCFSILFLPQALAKNIANLLINRFLQGIFGSLGVSLVGGTLSDIWDTSERGLPMAIFSFSAFATTGLGPVFFGVTTQVYGFKYVFWVLFAISAGYCFILASVLSETRASVILSRKAARLRKETGNDHYSSRGELERSSLKVMISTSLTRPAKMLVTEPIIIAFTIWIAFAWSCLYILLESMGTIFRDYYNFDLSEQGYAFITQFIGSVLGLCVNHYGNKLYVLNVAAKGPEARLYNAMVGAVLLPLGAWAYAWLARPAIHWIAPCLSVVVMFAGMFLIYLTVFSFLADCYTEYASSALAAMNFLRNVLAAIAPLYTRQMYDSLGVAGAGSLVAGIATILAVTPFVLFRWGKALGGRSRFSPGLSPKGESSVKN